MFKTNHWYHWISALAFWSFGLVFYLKEDIDVWGYGRWPIVLFMLTWGLFRALNGYLIWKKNRQ
ncbi:MAG: hypothetical protein CK532_03970 [Flavobacteriales bacterium]|nr:hypothetical protein [Flavobacteriaceae bacterium]PHX92255.1 MAG: hypothetical protein CK532_03970 [Flavobacteriales bacterium]